MSMHAFNRMLAPLKRRLQLILSRGVGHLSNPDTELQELQIELLSGEVLDGVEHFEAYGYTSRPHPGHEVAAASLAGKRSHTVCLVAADRRYRLKGLAKGEVALYDDLGHQVHLTRDGIVIRGAGQQVLITGTPKLRVEADIEATGQIKDLCDSSGNTMSSMRAAYNSHTHPGDSGGTTGTPNQEM